MQAFKLELILPYALYSLEVIVTLTFGSRPSPVSLPVFPSLSVFILSAVAMAVQDSPLTFDLSIDRFGKQEKAS